MARLHLPESAALDVFVHRAARPTVAFDGFDGVAQAMPEQFR
jgi:hypothetical protein